MVKPFKAAEIWISELPELLKLHKEWWETWNKYSDAMGKQMDGEKAKNIPELVSNHLEASARLNQKLNDALLHAYMAYEGD